MDDKIEDRVSRGLRLISAPLIEHVPQWQDAKQTNNAQKMQNCLDVVHERCLLFQKTCPVDYTATTKHLLAIFQAISECRKLPTGTELENRAFIAKADEALARLLSAVQGLLQS